MSVQIAAAVGSVAAYVACERSVSAVLPYMDYQAVLVCGFEVAFGAFVLFVCRVRCKVRNHVGALVEFAAAKLKIVMTFEMDEFDEKI